MSPSTILFADGEVGHYCAKWVIDNYKHDICCLVTTKQNDIHEIAKDNEIPVHVFVNDSEYYKFLKSRSIVSDLGLLLWWPKLVSSVVINSAKNGFINTHPSFLPFNRGKNYNFCSLVEQTPFGVSLHMVEEGIDCGDIVAQREIGYDWEDNGETLYCRAIAELKSLFIDTYPRLRSKEFCTKPQCLSLGTLHFSSELDQASRIYLDKPTTPRQVLNLLRARTFKGHPACYFFDNGDKYEVRVQIIKK